MGFFSDLKEDLSQAVNELLPDTEETSETKETETPENVETTALFYDIVPDGGSIDLAYRVTIENAQAGEIEYHLDIRAK